ncbi:hypothetical protein F7734_52950 [Scytonema sp. UIC 10036]|uniref:hypothetical protein n=1 Tax=Scytonema sp. UIC 10036 TaxID=2304196 RepID=UPI0012DA2316|nr:hypothetical protein [Scytonema sp. UIC 10036]MUH00525.1 hypothetical protein [Scytonema sp. UIC 10036]
MKNGIFKWVVICALCAFLTTSLPAFGPQGTSIQTSFTKESLKNTTAKAFPNFPLVYFGSGRFQEIGNPQNQLVSTYEFDMKQGINRDRLKATTIAQMMLLALRGVISVSFYT